MPYTPTADFLRWYVARMTCGPLFLAAYRNCAVCSNLLEHLQVPPLRLMVQIRLPVLGPPGLQPVSKLPAATLLEDLRRSCRLGMLDGWPLPVEGKPCPCRLAWSALGR